MDVALDRNVGNCCSSAGAVGSQIQTAPGANVLSASPALALLWMIRVHSFVSVEHLLLPEDPDLAAAACTPAQEGYVLLYNSSSSAITLLGCMPADVGPLLCIRLTSEMFSCSATDCRVSAAAVKGLVCGDIETYTFASATSTTGCELQTSTQKQILT